MNRREAIKNASVALGGVLCSGTILAVMQGCKASPKVDWSPSFLDSEQALTVNAMVDVILPKTATLPGGVELGVPAFIDDTLDRFWEAEKKQKMKSALQDFDQKCRHKYGASYHDLNQSDRTKAMESIVVSGKDLQPGEFYLFTEMKGLALAGYFTTEEVCKNVLKFVPVPNEQRGCVDLQEATGGVKYAI